MLILENDKWTGQKYVYYLADRLCSLQVSPRPIGHILFYCFSGVPFFQGLFDQSSVGLMTVLNC